MRRRSPTWIAVLAALAGLSVAAGAGAQGLIPPEDATDLQSVKDLETAAAAKAKVAELKPVAPMIIQAGAVDPAAYRLGPGDQLEINLWGRIVRTIPVEVSPEGTVFLPGRGTIDVQGKTLAWARERVLKVVGEEYVGVHADVRLVHLREFKVYLSGQVKSPGAAEANSATRASEVVAQIGLAEGASRRNISVQRSDGSSSRLDLDGFERLGRLDLNPWLSDGDRIVVPFATKYVYVSGAVSHPEQFELGPDDSLSTLIGLGGGLLESASPQLALLVRFKTATERESLFVDLRGATMLTMPLSDGDRLFVPFRPEYHELPIVGITGEVVHPGAYPIVTGRDRLSDLILWAGGFRPTANRTILHLIRGGQAQRAATEEKDPEFDRLVRLSREQMTESEYTKLETKLAERENSFRVDWSKVTPGSATDPLLQADDLVRVDRFVPSVRVEGQVLRPGLVDYVAGRTVKEYIDLAGGFTERAAKTSVRVTRAVTGQVVPSRGIKSIQPGDFVWVPERRDVDVWAAFRDIVIVTGQVAVIIFTFSK